jgi:hypothetical protein
VQTATVNAVISLPRDAKSAGGWLSFWLPPLYTFSNRSPAARQPRGIIFHCQGLTSEKPPTRFPLPAAVAVERFRFSWE